MYESVDNVSRTGHRLVKISAVKLFWGLKKPCINDWLSV